MSDVIDAANEVVSITTGRNAYSANRMELLSRFLADAILVHGRTPAGLAAENARLREWVRELREALRIARRTMQNERYNKPRIGMESECELVDAALAATATKETPCTT